MSEGTQNENGYDMRVLLLLNGLSVAYAAVCGLCSHPGDDVGVNGLMHPLEFVDSKGKMCAQLMIELFRLDAGSPECVEWYNKSHIRCCHPQVLPSIPQDPPPPPPQFVVDGPYAKCDLCVGGGYPGITSMVINMLYIGPGSCPQYYEWGQKGWIQDRLCQSLQHFASEPCGCAHIINRRKLTAKKDSKERRECGMK